MPPFLLQKNQLHKIYSQHFYTVSKIVYLPVNFI